MTVPYTPTQSWSETLARRLPKQTDMLDQVLGNRFGTQPTGTQPTSAPNTAQPIQAPIQAPQMAAVRTAAPAASPLPPNPFLPTQPVAMPTVPTPSAVPAGVPPANVQTAQPGVLPTPTGAPLPVSPTTPAASTQTVQPKTTTGTPTGGDIPMTGDAMPPDPTGDAARDLVNKTLANPNPYNSDLVTSMWNTRAQDLDNQYNQRERQLEGNLAARGINDSTFGGQAQQALAGQYRTAGETALQNLMEEVAGAQTNSTSAAIAEALGLRGQDWNRTMDVNNFNQQQEQFNTLLNEWLVSHGLGV